MQCTNCGVPLPAESRFCTSCGAPVVSIPQISSAPVRQKKRPSVFVLVVCAFLALCVGFGSAALIFRKPEKKVSLTAEEKAYMQTAVQELQAGWIAQIQTQDEIFDYRYMEILGSELVLFPENDDPNFSDVMAVAEFQILCDYFQSAPYFPCFTSSVVFHRDGSTEFFRTSFFDIIRSRIYSTDFTDLVEKWIPLGDLYNGAYLLMPIETDP